MSDDEKPVPLQPRHSKGILSSWRNRAEAIAERRAIEEGNRMMEAAVQGQKVKGQYYDASREAERARARLSNVDDYVETDAMELRARLDELTLKQEQLRAEAGEITSAHEARMAQNEADRLRAEADQLKQEIEIERLKEQKRKALVRSGQTRVEYEAELKQLKEQLVEKKTELEALLDPSRDGDERTAPKKRAISEELRQIKARIEVLAKELEHWD